MITVTSSNDWASEYQNLLYGFLRIETKQTSSKTEEVTVQ